MSPKDTFMLIRFVVSNFLSFDKEGELTMIASNLKTHKNHVYPLGKLNVLKSAAIYGANGAGKSNLIKAIEYLQNVVELGGLDENVNQRKFKLNKENENKPIEFEIEFAIQKKIYAYGVSLHNFSVTEEWLYESALSGTDKIIFERKTLKNGKSSIRLADKHNKTDRQKLLVELMEDSLLKNYELLLGKAESFKIKELDLVVDYIKHNLVVIHPGSKYNSLVTYLSLSPSFKKFTNDLLKSFDTGVAELGIEVVPLEKFFGEDAERIRRESLGNLQEGEPLPYHTHMGWVLISLEKGKYIVKKAVARHVSQEGLKVNFDLAQESDGTQRLLDFIPAFDGILHHDITFIIDEIDQSLHPALLKSLTQKIMSEPICHGQLIFSTHESNLLDLEIFRQDEIWFVEKDKKVGSSMLYSLNEFKPRYDLDIRKGYLKGRFGAIPFLSKLDDLKWQATHEKEKKLPT